MYAIPSITFVGLAFMKYAPQVKAQIELAVKLSQIPRDALIADDRGLVRGVVNGGVYNPFPV